MNRRGLSDVVATVLTILMVLMAVVIVWNFTKPVLNKIGVLDSATFDAKLSIPKDSIVLDQTNNKISFSVKREQGSGEVSGLIFGLEDVNGNVRAFRQNATINELEMRDFEVNYSGYGISDVLSISVTPIYINNNTNTEQNGKTISQKLDANNKIVR